jgi:hypothetical protein
LEKYHQPSTKWGVERVKRKLEKRERADLGYLTTDAKVSYYYRRFAKFHSFIKLLG